VSLLAPAPAHADYASTVLSDSPLAYYKLGETSGTVATDSSGQGKNGTYVNGVSLGAPGPLVGVTNYAASFNGTSAASQF